MAAKRQKIHFESVEELLGAPITKDVTEEIQFSQIRPFKDHPFKVIDDSRMEDLVKSIAVNGVLTPVMLRPSADGGYEMVSGHRRMHTAKLAGKTAIGDTRFVPYKTEQSANRGRKAWETLYEKIGELDLNWKYQIGGVMPVSEFMFEEMEEQRAKDNEIASKTMNRMFADILERAEDADRRRNIKRIK